MQPKAINISLVSFPIKRETVAVYWSEHVEDEEPGAGSPLGCETMESRKELPGKEALDKTGLPLIHHPFSLIASLPSVSARFFSLSSLPKGSFRSLPP